MAKVAKIHGIDKVLRNLNKEIDKIQGKTKLGLRLAALEIKGRAADYTPRDTGNLVNSSYVVVEGGDTDADGNFVGEDAGELKAAHQSGLGRARGRTRAGKTLRAEVGYTAYYSIFVHEIDKAYRKPGSSWKFLEKAIREKADRVLDIISKEAEL